MPRFTEMPTQMAELWRQSLGQEIIQGQLYDDYYEPMPPVYAPTWNVSSQGQIKTTKTLTGGTSASPAQYIVSSISLSGQKR